MSQRRRTRRAGGVKGRALLLFRLARQDIRHHLAQAVLLVVAIAAATAVLSLAFALTGVITNPYQQTMAATKGPDVVAQSGYDPYTGVTSPAGLAALEALNHVRGVAAHSGPYPIVGDTGPVGPVMRSADLVTSVEVEGREPGVAAVDQPKVTDGTWIRPGGVVVERSFAEVANLRLGQTITLNGRRFRVVGFAVTSAFGGFPGTSLIWATEAAARSLAAKADPVSYISNLRLSDASPRAVNAFVNAYGLKYSAPADATAPFLTSWTEVAYGDAAFLRTDQAFLFTGTVLLGLLALASVAVLVGGRLAEATRRVGLLKATGGTPGLVAAAFLAENLFLALAAALAGLLAGWRAAPFISKPEADLVGTPGAPPLTLVTVLVAVGVALAVALASTLVPAIRAARMSTVSALADTPRLPKRRDWLIGLSRKLPLPALLGLRLVARRPRRAIFSAASIAVAVMGLVAALAIHAAVGNKFAHLGTSGGLVNPDVPRAEQVLTAITISLVALAALTVIFAALATVLDARRACAVTLAVGATPQQVRAGLIMAQVIPALPGAILGLPLGIGLFKVAGHGLNGLPPAGWLVAAVLGTVVVVAALTTVPARIGLRRPVAEMLQTEST
ncbi:MAG TPA: FtsX-like permease family protein [Trebonia sp.]|jgi:putative ABC transport system permease protein|nr:FtsX-like permease family protein [Trebonia sp.]